VVTDAGGNSLVHVSPKGETTTLAVFQSRSTGRDTDSVPTTVVSGPDGALYVGELTGFPFPVGGANIYRVVPPAAPQVFLTGFTMIIDIAWGRDGSLYVLEFSADPATMAPG
jgi:glucose/arabinose dehydrogenase